MTRETAISPRAHLLHFSLAALVVLVVGLDSLADVLQGELAGPDSYLRLVRIREALDHGTWFGNAIARDASGLGVASRWAHELDLGILLMRAPLSLALPPDRALFWAGALVGPLCVGLLGLLCAWAVAPIASVKWRWIAAPVVAAAPAIIGYGRIGGATHHIAIAAWVVGAWGAGGRVACGSAADGVLLGMFAALGIWLTPEAMPLTMMAFGAGFLAWLARPSTAVAQGLERAGMTLLVLLTSAFLFDPPPAGYGAVVLDRLSVPFLCLAALVCALCWLLRLPALAARSLAVRATSLAIAGAGAVALWFLLFPGFIGGLTGLMTADEARAIFTSLAEWQPLDDPAAFVAVAGPGSIAALAAFVLAWRARATPAGLLWAYAGLGGVVCVGLAASHIRFAPYASAAGAMMLTILLARVEDGAGLWRILYRPGLIMLFLLVPAIGGQLYEPPPVYSAQGINQPDGAPRCPMPAAVRLLRPYGGAVVVADLNVGPELLYRTDVKIVGSIYHWNIAGAMRLRAAWRARDLDQVSPELRAAGAQYILACRGLSRSPFVDGPETTLFDRLNRGDPPAWLRLVGQAEGTGWTLYAVPPTLNTPS